MLETYADFMIFMVKDNGERSRLNITEEIFHQNQGAGILHSSQVAIIVKEGLRRIYIWKGISSSVRKKFIASRVASEIQKELFNSSNFHQCKIVSVDQGDEPREFLNIFSFLKMHILVDENVPINPNVTNLENISDNGSNQNDERNGKDHENKNFVIVSQKSPTYGKLKKFQKSQETLEKVLKTNISKNFIRRNILIGNNLLYGEIIKKAEIFSNYIEEQGWERISTFPKEIIEIDGVKLRFHINIELAEIEAIEILEKSPSLEKPIEDMKGVEYEKWTVKQLKQYCRETNLKVPPSYRKADIVHLIVKHATSNQ